MKRYLFLLLLAVVTAPPATGGDSSRVTYLAAREVEASFEQGAVLFEGSRYMVHASRREKPGKAEVHLKDADIIYVLKGSATIVTGGEVVHPVRTAEDEIRGDSIQGGESRHLVPGDVLIVPENTPHWFQQVEAPFLYYVVKAR